MQEEEKIAFKTEFIRGKKVTIQVIPVGMQSPHAKKENEYVTETIDQIEVEEEDIDHLTNKIKKNNLIEFDDEEVSAENY